MPRVTFASKANAPRSDPRLSVRPQAPHRNRLPSGLLVKLVWSADVMKSVAVGYFQHSAPAANGPVKGGSRTHIPRGAEVSYAPNSETADQRADYRDLVAPSGSADPATTCPRCLSKEKPSNLEGFHESG